MLYFFIKRVFDLFISLISMIFLIPLFCLVALCIKTTSNGPVFFSQYRVGKDGKLFKIFKFRTMIVNAEKQGIQLTSNNDTRVTYIGSFLRKSKIDELPQLFNVLKGDMSIVGPRPVVLRFVSLYNKKQKEILKVKPGLTDPASIQYINEQAILANVQDPEKFYIEELMDKKIQLSRQYINNMSLRSDIVLIFKTGKEILKKIAKG